MHTSHPFKGTGWGGPAGPHRQWNMQPQPGRACPDPLRGQPEKEDCVGGSLAASPVTERNHPSGRGELETAACLEVGVIGTEMTELPTPGDWGF